VDFERPVPTFHLLAGFASSLAVRRQRTLNLSGNRLERVWAGTFVALSSLSSVDLSRNRLARLPEATFGPDLSIGWVDHRVRFGRIDIFFSFSWVGLVWVRYSKSTKKLCSNDIMARTS